MTNSPEDNPADESQPTEEEWDEYMDRAMCPECGKEYEDFSDIGCGRCDQRSPDWGMMP